MIVEYFHQYFLRDINKLKEEISLYKNESNLWIVNGEIKNSAGTIALHLIGNLKYFVGAQLENTGYLRQREKEFSEKNIPREKIISEINETLFIVKNAFSDIKDNDLHKEYPVEFIGQKRTIGFMLITLLTHLNYHLGQINYHRRLMQF